MAALTPEVDFAAALAEVGIGTVGTTIKYGPPESDELPGNSAVIYWVTTVGSSAQPLLNVAVSGTHYVFRVQLTVWGTADSKSSGRALARAAREAIHTKHPTLTSLSSYISVVVDPGRAEPFYLGQLPSGRSEYTLEFLLEAFHTN